MKIDRVILSTNDNPTYYHFWNPLSKVYKEKFGIKPTLIFFGDNPSALGLSEQYGNIITQRPCPEYHIPWQTTWGLFYFTKYYPDDVCIIMGIDQVPLSRMFLDNMIAPYNDDTYAMLIADAYLPHHWSKEGSASPSSYHIAKGSTFQKVHKFDYTFEMECKNIHSSGMNGFWENTEGRWGIDETWSSKNLRDYKGEIVSLNGFGKLVERRIECERHKETPYDLDKLKQGWYSESHLCRPFTNHTEYITNLFNNIPNYVG